MKDNAAIKDRGDKRSHRAYSRRQFLVSAALGLASTIPGVAQESVAAKVPKKGGRLRMGISGGFTIDSLDPASITDAFMTLLSFGQLRNNLVEINERGEAVPELAESWDVSPDAKVWHFRLRRGVEFHHGKTLDATDVIASINHHRGETSISPAKIFLNNISHIRADGKYSVVFELYSGQADFPFLLADVRLTVQPAGADVTAGIGTGGYQLVEFEPGVRSLTTRYPNYWKAGCAHFNEVETLSISDVNARTMALQTGEIDVINRCELKTLHLLRRLPNVQIVHTIGTKHYSLPMHMDVAPFDNNDIRLALKYAIDRPALVQTILRGYGSVGNDHPISRSQRYFAPQITQHEYDPDKARFYLRRAGFSALSLQLSTSDAAFPGAVDTAVLYKEQAADSSITIDVVREPADGYWKNVWLRKPFCLCSWNGQPTAGLMFATGYAQGAPWNDTHFSHERFNHLLKTAQAELDEQKRAAQYAEMQRIVHDDGGVIIPLFAADVCAAKRCLQFGPLASHRELDGGKCAERWWWGEENGRS